eukprot:scaffold8301_cov184-Cylindrotheca_fusiformis.AAC.8
MALTAQQDQVSKDRKFQAAGDDLVSVTVRKSDPNQKAGVKVVQRQDGIYITGITKNGLLDNTQIAVGDKLLSINGKRLRRGEDTHDFMKLISTSRDKVTMVVKKANSKRTNSIPPKKEKVPQKLVQKEAFRKPDGSFDYEINPELTSYQKAVAANVDDKEQILVPAKKYFREQDCGLTFKKKRDMLFVNGITLDSIFKDTQLEFGDRVVSVNDVNFMTYADANYAATLLKRAKGDVNIIVEKGWAEMDMNVDVDPHHDKPCRVSVARPDVAFGNNTVDHKPRNVVEQMLDKLDSQHRAIKDRQSGRLDKSFDSTDSKKVEENDLSGNTSLSTLDKLDASKKSDNTSLSTLDRLNSQRTAVVEKSQTGRLGKSQDDKKTSLSPLRTADSELSQDQTPSNAVAKMLNKLDSEKKAIRERHAGRLNRSFDSTDNEQDKGVGINSRTLSPLRKADSPLHESRNPCLGSLRFLREKGDFICVSVKKISEIDPGVRVKKREDRFILHKLPNHEKRIPVGVRVLAINGNADFRTVVEAKEVINATKDEVVLFIDFQDLVAVRGSDLMQLIGQ